MQPFGANETSTLRRAKSTSSVPRKPVPGSLPSDSQAGHSQHAVVAAHRALNKAKELDQAQEPAGKIHRTQSTRPTTTRRARRSGDGRLSGEGSHLSRRNSTRTVRSESQRKPASLTQKSTPQLRQVVEQIATNGSLCSDDHGATALDKAFAERYDGYGISARVVPHLPVADPSPGMRNGSNGGQSFTQTYSSRENGLKVIVPCSRENQTDESILAMARDRYLREQMTPLKRRSSFLLPFRSLTRKARRELLPVSEPVAQSPSTNAPEPEHQTPEQIPPNPVRPAPPPPDTTRATNQTKSRSLSGTFGSLKRGWRRTFGRSPSSQQADFPIQHVVVEALYRSRDEQGGIKQRESSPHEYPDLFEDLPEIPPAPPPHLVGFGHSVPYAYDGFDSEDHHDHHAALNSRISSWNDSTRHNTIVLPDSSALSIIRESPEKHDASHTTLSGGYPLVQAELSETISFPIKRGSSLSTIKPNVDGRRLVSALMKHRRERSGDDTPSRKASLSNLFRKSSDADRTAVLPELTDPSYHMSASIRDVSAELPFGYFAQAYLPTASKVDAPVDRSQLVSPSVYSERNDADQTMMQESSSVHLPSTPPGVATVLQSEAVSKWSLEDSQKQHKHSTSNEWRVWAADEFAGLEGWASFSIPDFSRHTMHTDHRSSLDYRRNIEQDQRHGHSPAWPPSPWQTSNPQQPARNVTSRREQLNNLESDESSPIPMKASMIPIPRRKSSLTAIHLTSGQSHTQPHQNDEVFLSHNPSMREPSNHDLLAKARDQVRSDPLPKNSTAGIRVQGIGFQDASSEPSPHSDADSLPPRRRRQRMDDNFLLRIRRGPYGIATGSLAKTPTSSVDSISLPKRPSAAVGAIGKENTPPSRGQKMASEFLSSRSSANLSAATRDSPTFL